MTTNYDKLIAVLKEVFMLDKAELDFGIYRIMNQKRADITQFLQQDLVPQVKTILAQNGSGDRKALEKQLDDAVKQAQALGMEPDAVPKVKELRAQLADIPDLTALENDVFSGLATFFKRYFDNGDFISMRRYKRDVYAIPYEGEEVKLHWANADQYYIKTAEYLKHYRFRLDDTHHVSFDLLEASTEQNNNKAQGDKERRFALCPDRPLEAIGDTLHIYFTYEPTDKKRKQDDLLAEAADKLKPLIPADFLPLLALSPTEKNKNRTLLEKHLRDYTARNTFDYFIHKDLGGFLRRELDFYIKNEVLFLDDLDTVDDRQVLAQLAKVRALRQIGEKIIQFLAQLEDFQKRLWLKKKLVVDSQYCITLDRVPEAFYDEIAQNEAQADEWVRLFAIDQIAADAITLPYARPLTVAFLKQNPALVLDTAFFSEDFKLQLLAELPDLDANTDGLLINSENFQALNLLQERYKEQVKCVYIDPPYNTDASAINYKNDYRSSSWISLIDSRIDLGKNLLMEDGLLCATIDDFQQKELSALLESKFPEGGLAGTVIIRNNPSGRPTQTGFALAHEYGIFARKSKWSIIGRMERSEEQLERFGEKDDKGIYELRNLRREGSNSEREKRRKLYYPIYATEDSFRVPELEWNDNKSEWIPLNHPIKNEIVIYPIDDNGVERTWRWGIEKVNADKSDVLVRKIRSGKLGIYVKYRPNSEGAVTPTIWADSKYSATEHGTGVLKKLFTTPPFSYPKSIYAVEDSLLIMGLRFRTGTALDYFAGSGTTGHAVINLNREDEGKRKYILVEMGEYFDTVTKPRIQKVIYSKDWRDGKPVGRVGISHCFKYLRLESYEDTLNNLSLSRTAQQELALGGSAQFREGYLLRYMLDVESRASLFDVARFRNPFACYIDVTKQNERTPTRVDLVETFNYLIGLVVEGQYTSGPNIRVVTGQTLGGEKTLIIWRNQDEVDNAALNEWLQKSGYNPRDREFDRIYVNGDNHLENLRRDDESWKVTLIEAEFSKRMG